MQGMGALPAVGSVWDLFFVQWELGGMMPNENYIRITGITESDGEERSSHAESPRCLLTHDLLFMQSVLVQTHQQSTIMPNHAM